MPTVKKTDGPRGYIRALGRRVSVGETYEVSQGEAEYVLEERDDFELVEGQLGSEDETDADEGETDSDDEEASDGDGFDAEAFVDRSPMDDVIEDIEAGGADEYLDAVQAAEEDGRDRVGVQDAIGERRAELEG